MQLFIAPQAKTIENPTKQDISDAVTNMKPSEILMIGEEGFKQHYIAVFHDDATSYMVRDTRSSGEQYEFSTADQLQAANIMQKYAFGTGDYRQGIDWTLKPPQAANPGQGASAPGFLMQRVLLRLLLPALLMIAVYLLQLYFR